MNYTITYGKVRSLAVGDILQRRFPTKLLDCEIKHIYNRNGTLIYHFSGFQVPGNCMRKMFGMGKE